MNDLQLIPEINKTMELNIADTVSNEELHSRLASRINELISDDFQKLINLLYRIDVNEKKLKTLLAENTHTDAGAIIATLVIERQLEKIKSRQQFSKRDESIDQEERWDD